MKLNIGWRAALLGVALVGGTVRAEDAKPEAPKPVEAKVEKMGPKKVLEKFDSNGDGKITGAEAEALRKAFAGKWKKQLERYDKDGNGKLDDNEIAAIKPKKVAMKEQEAKEAKDKVPEAKK